ncbi:beta-N-acetylhexosaminidase [Streptomyces laurentii]|uniref:beta-N-acetylhexosaminidase n=1 Tax=Streptomyces laurentii TaxID=39478 RepID=UPI003679EA11
MNAHPPYADLDLIPAPREAARRGGATGAPDASGAPGYVTLDERTTVDAGPGTHRTARWLRAVLGAATGLPLADGAGPHAIRLRISADAEREHGPEGYVLSTDGSVADAAVVIEGGGPAGVFWAAQTLRQLLGPEAHRTARVAPAGHAWNLPFLTVTDAPRFRWRGLMLDVARHFMPKTDVLRQLDLMAAHKLNVLHLHLTDDQGWRVEIERHPRLTEVGSWRARSKWGHRESSQWNETPHGGFYTHDDLREIVAYAADRHITVVPEIDLPGHSQAAIAAYPELGNGDVVDTTALPVWDTWGVNPNVLAPTDAVLRFYEDVFEEILGLFPSPYVHIGGDECPKDQWKASPTARARIEELGVGDEDGLQAWFVRHFDRWLAARGRRLVGWDEILEGGPAAGTPLAPLAESGTAVEDGAVTEGGTAVEGGAVTGSGAYADTGGTTGLGLTPGATVSSWRGYAGGIAAAEAGHDVVMCPEQQVYLDHRQDPGEDEPMPIGYVRTLADVYRFEPVPPGLSEAAAAHILGTQANVWTEVMENRSRVDYQTQPRLAAFAEVAWSELPAPDARDLAGFERRMTAHYRRLDALGVEYRPPGGPRPWHRRPGVPGRPLEGTPPNV